MNLEQPPSVNNPVNQPWDTEPEDESPLLDLGLVMIRRGRTIFRTTGIFVLLGLMLAIFGKPQYTSSVKLIREAVDTDLSQSSAVAALRGLGLSFGGGTSGLTEDTFPDILASKNANLALIRQGLHFCWHMGLNVAATQMGPGRILLIEPLWAESGSLQILQRPFCFWQKRTDRHLLQDRAWSLMAVRSPA